MHRRGIQNQQPHKNYSTSRIKTWTTILQSPQQCGRTALKRDESGGTCHMCWKTYHRSNLILSILQQFYAKLRKTDGSKYEPDSLRTMIVALDRHLRNTGATFSIIEDQQLQDFQKVLNGKAIELWEKWKGKKKQKRADALTHTQKSSYGPRICWEVSLSNILLHYQPALWHQGLPGASPVKYWRFEVCV